MKKRISYGLNDKKEIGEITYIPIRYILAVLISVIETLAILGVITLIYMRYRWFAVICAIAHIGCVIRIISSDDNPDYKVPWLLCVLSLPIVGFMLYFLFYSRKLDRKFIKRIKSIQELKYEKDDTSTFEKMSAEDKRAESVAMMLTEISYSHVFDNVNQKYFPSGETMMTAMIDDLMRAERFIFLEYFIIEDGIFWSAILDVLKFKAEEGLDVKLIYDDIGCMTTLPGNYYKTLRKHKIDAIPFSILRGQANNEFNNRSHRKILVIDGKIAYTGGINIADEYINQKERFGHWKDTGIRLEGDAVKEFTWLFLSHFGLNSKELPSIKECTYPNQSYIQASGYIVPFGDGPRPIYKHNVGKSVIRNMLDASLDYVYITTPYLIIDNDTCTSIENAAMRGVDVRIIVPHIPDKKLVFAATRSFYHRLMSAGVRIYEYTPGFIHAKTYISDDKYVMIGTINLDYRSLVHHFENGVWMYKCECIEDIKLDVVNTMEQCMEITEEMLSTGPLRRFIRSVIRLFAPLL